MILLCTNLSQELGLVFAVIAPQPNNMSDNPNQLKFDFPDRVLDFELDESHDCSASPEDGCSACPATTEEDGVITDK